MRVTPIDAVDPVKVVLEIGHYYGFTIITDKYDPELEMVQDLKKKLATSVPRIFHAEWSEPNTHLIGAWRE